jgi:formylglycine-generating enzyme required for sulfatase activity
LIIVSILGVDVWRRSQEMNLNVFGIWALAQLGLYEGPQLVKIPGTDEPFQMGSYNCAEGDESDVCPQHPVTIQPFWIGKFEVTFDEYIAFVKDTNGVKLPYDWDFGHGSRPVISVSWEDAKAYTDWLSNVTGKSFRLPTEAEWEYAARAGTTTYYWWGDGVNKDGKIWANCADSGSRWSGEETAPVGSFSKNGFGLYDMHGNVWEWCADWYDDDYYKNSPKDNPKGPKKGKGRVVRGGSWNDGAEGCRSAYRSFGAVGFVYHDVGFRVARSDALGP